MKMNKLLIKLLYHTYVQIMFGAVLHIFVKAKWESIYYWNVIPGTDSFNGGLNSDAQG